MTARVGALKVLHDEITSCRACPRLVAWREQVAREKRRAYADCDYWARGVPGFGDARARIVIVGLAPAAHGANRTGRIFTGDRSGDFLFAALHRAGLASQSVSAHRSDGLKLFDVFIVAPVRCAPPQNRPTPDEIQRCSPFFDREIEHLQRARVLLALGAIAWTSIFRHLARRGARPARSTPVFGHAAMYRSSGLTVVGSYHVSQQNTQTGRLTPAMFDRVLRACIREVASAP